MPSRRVTQTVNRMPKQSEWIINTTDATFEADVMARSKKVWSSSTFGPIGAPCRMLGPVLEQLANESDGQFTLVKADTADNQQAAGEFGVSGIPAVFAVLDGQIVDGFPARCPRRTMRLWLEKLEAAATLLQAKQLAERRSRGGRSKDPRNSSRSTRQRGRLAVR